MIPSTEWKGVIALTKKSHCDNVLRSEGKFSKQFLEETIRVWQPLSPAPLSTEDAEEIAQNMIALVTLLNEIGRDGE